MKSGEKSSLRSKIRKDLLDLSCKAQDSKSKQIRQLLEQSNHLDTANPVLTFAALPGEPDLKPLFERRKPHQILCFPRVIGSRLEIRRVSSAAELIPGYADILEPSPESCPLFPIQKLRTILVPGLAFDPSSGGRLGKGKGFYDRLLDELRSSSDSPPITIGVCFDCQLTQVPQQGHDQNIDSIVTEKGIILTSAL